MDVERYVIYLSLPVLSHIIDVKKVNGGMGDNQAACSDVNTEFAIFSCQSIF